MLNITLTNFISHQKLQFVYWNNSISLIEYQNLQSQSPCNQIFYFRSSTCELLAPDGKTVCKDCNALKQTAVSERNWKSKKVSIPAKPEAPITLTSPERLKANSVTLMFSFWGT